MAGGRLRAPRWAWALMALLLVAVTAVSYLALQPRAAAGHRAPADPAPPARVLIVGDSFTSGTKLGGFGEDNWTQLVLAEQEFDVDAVIEAGGGSGYARGGLRRFTFEQLAAEGGTGFDLVVFFGSVNDAGGVLEGARAAFATARTASPDAELLVIGPTWVAEGLALRVLASRDALALATEEFGGTFVDAIDEGWFSDATGLVGSDRIHPTDKGHRYLADRIGPHLRDALETLDATA